MNRDGTDFIPGADTPAALRACFYAMFIPVLEVPQLFRRTLTSSVDGQMRESKECPFSGVTMQSLQSLEVGSRKARSGLECE